MNFSHSTYSHDGRGVSFILQKLTKLGSNKRKANKALITKLMNNKNQHVKGI